MYLCQEISKKYNKRRTQKGRKMRNKNYNRKNLQILGKEWLLFNRNSLKTSTIQTYEYLFEKHIAESQLASLPIHEVTAESIVVFSESLLQVGLSPKTINSVLLTIHSIFK